MKNQEKDQDFTAALAKNTLDDIPTPKSDAKDIVGVVKKAVKLPAISFLTEIPSQKKRALPLQKKAKLRVSVLHIEKIRNI